MLWTRRGKAEDGDVKETHTSDLACCADSPFTPDSTDILAGSGGGVCEMHVFCEVDCEACPKSRIIEVSLRFLGVWKFKLRPQLIR